MHTGGDGGENGRTQRTALVRGDDIQWAIHHIAAGLHNRRGFPRDAAQGQNALDRDLLLFEALHYCACAKCGGGDQTAKQRGGIGAQIKVGNHPFQPLIGIWRAATVKPVQHHRQMVELRVRGPGLGQILNQTLLHLSQLRFQLRMLLRRQLQRPAQ